MATILTALRKDNHLSKTFDGSAKNGVISGFYTNIALFNGGMVIGYVKIKGQYNRDKGDLSFEIVPSNVYWLVLIFAIGAIGFLTYKGLTEDNMLFMGAFLFLFLILGWTLAHMLEGRHFIKHIKRISILRNE